MQPRPVRVPGLRSQQHGGSARLWQPGRRFLRTPPGCRGRCGLCSALRILPTTKDFLLDCRWHAGQCSCLADQRRQRQRYWSQDGCLQRSARLLSGLAAPVRDAGGRRLRLCAILFIRILPFLRPHVQREPPPRAAGLLQRLLPAQPLQPVRIQLPHLPALGRQP